LGLTTGDMLMKISNVNRSKLAAAILPLAGAAAIAGVAHAALPLGGLTVAVSPAGDKLVAGGTTRTILVLDPETLAVKARHWTGYSITGLSFDKSGRVLLVSDTDDAVHLFETTGWKKTASLPRRYHLTISTEGGVLAGADRSSGASAIHIHSLRDGKETAKIAINSKQGVFVMGFDAAGKRLAVLSTQIDTKEEQKLSYNQIPKELRDLARSEFEQRNDGKVSVLRVYDVAKGTMLWEKTTFYSMSTSRPRLVFDGDNVVTHNYSNVGARITPQGEVKLFKTASGNYAIEATVDQKFLMTGGLRDLAITNVNTLQSVKGEIDRLPSWPEYFSGFSAPASNAVFFGGTTAYRVIKFGPDGKVLSAVPVQ